MTHSALALRDRLIPWYIVAFFVVIAVVDGVMVTLAVRTQPGLVTDHAYEKGLAYNRTIEAEEKQAALGWKGAVNVLSGSGRDLTVGFDLRDADGRAQVPEKATARFSRPAQGDMDFTAILTDSKVAVFFPALGVWDVTVRAEYHGNIFQHVQRIIVK